MLEIRVVHNRHVETMQCVGDAIGFEACDHDHGTYDAALDRSLYNARDHGLAVDIFKQFVARPHARGASSGEHDGRDGHFRPLPRCTAVISAMMETAISAAPCAPISRPIGA